MYADVQFVSLTAANVPHDVDSVSVRSGTLRNRDLLSIKIVQNFMNSRVKNKKSAQPHNAERYHSILDMLNQTERKP